MKGGVKEKKKKKEEEEEEKNKAEGDSQVYYQRKTFLMKNNFSFMFYWGTHLYLSTYEISATPFRLT